MRWDDRRLRGANAALLVGALAACGSSDKPAETGYFLSGRVYDALTLEPLKDADLTLISGADREHVRSGADGAYTLGPIPPNTAYRVEGTLKDMEPFLFNGLPLPKLEDGQTTRSLFADVHLYESMHATPAFKVVLKSGNPRLSESLAVASIDFVPTRVGTDPATPAESDAEARSATTGAYAQADLTTLPNDAPSEASGYQVRVVNGEAQVPAGALHWGATYAVHVDAGPGFTPADFMLTPIHDGNVEVVLDPAAADGGGGGGAGGAAENLPQDTQQYFTGRIYDGVTLKRITDYSMRLEYYDRVINAQVDETGRYVVGPLLRNADYSIVFEATGYRSFLSHNQMLTKSNAELLSFYYDAFLYPSSVKAPAMKALFTLSDSAELPSGTVRFAPRSGSSLFDSVEETPAAIETPGGAKRQVWTNDEDLQQRAVVRSFTDGELDMSEGDFVLGVEYAVTVFGVDGHGILDGGRYRAGVDANPTFTLTPMAEKALDVVSTSLSDSPLAANNAIEFRFNHEIKFWPLSAEATMTRALNDNLSIDSPNADGDAKRNVLVSAPTTGTVAPDYRGVHATISGSSLTLQWDYNSDNSNLRLAQSDKDDPILNVTFGGLPAIVLYTGTTPNEQPTLLSDLVGNSVTIPISTR